MKFTKEQRDEVLAAAKTSQQALRAIGLAHSVQDPDAALKYLNHINGQAFDPIEAHGFCCGGFGWRVFSITADAIYCECDNPDCVHSNVFLGEEEIAGLYDRLAAWSDEHDGSH